MHHENTEHDELSTVVGDSHPVSRDSGASQANKPVRCIALNTEGRKWFI